MPSTLIDTLKTNTEWFMGYCSFCYRFEFFFFLIQCLSKFYKSIVQIFMSFVVVCSFLHSGILRSIITLIFLKFKCCNLFLFYVCCVSLLEKTSDGTEYSDTRSGLSNRACTAMTFLMFFGVFLFVILLYLPFFESA